MPPPSSPAQHSVTPYLEYTAAFIAGMDHDRQRRLEHMHACQLVPPSPVMITLLTTPGALPHRSPPALAPAACHRTLLCSALSSFSPGSHDLCLVLAATQVPVPLQLPR